GNQVALVLDRPRAAEDLPVRRAGREGEGRGDEQHLGARADQAAVELRKAQVVADREPERAELGGHRDRLGPGRARRRLAHRHAPRALDAEQVQLAIAPDELAARVEEAARVVGAWLAGRALEQRSRTEM